MRKSVIGILFICFAVVSFNASAALVSIDWKTVGDNLITRDTVSGLEWLDITETTGLSYNDVSSKLGEGEQFEGWGYASITEVRELLNNAGGSGLYNGVWSAENNGVVIPLLDLWGHTLTYADSYAITNDSSLFVPFSRNIVRLLDRSSYSESLTMDNINLGSGAAGNDSGYSYIGSALIRSTTVVPVPAAVWLFGSGLIGLIGLARCKKTIIFSRRCNLV